MSSKTSSEAKTAKLVTIGPAGVGKTSIITKAMKKIVDPNYTPTIGASFQTIPIKTAELNVILQCWDVAGGEQFQSLAPLYFRGSQIALFVYDITSKASFNQMIGYFQALTEKLPAECVLFLAGNKSDLVGKREVEWGNGESFAFEHAFKGFLEVSALTGDKIDELFEMVVSDYDVQYHTVEISLSESKEKSFFGSLFGRIPC